MKDEDDDDYEDVTLPTALTCHKLDTTEERAVTAGEQFTTIEKGLGDLHWTLGLYERALRESEPHSTRAHDARAALKDTLNALEPVFLGVDRARWALIRGWGTPPHTAGYPPAPRTTP